jgi:hypothetical protein
MKLIYLGGKLEDVMAEPCAEPTILGAAVNGQLSRLGWGSRQRAAMLECATTHHKATYVYGFF